MLIKSFVWSGVYETTTSSGQNIIILAQTRKNATPINPNQLINLFAAFDKSTVDMVVEQQGENSALNETLREKKKDLVYVFSPPEGFSWAGSDLIFAEQPSNPIVASLYDQGDIFSLLRPEDQKLILDFTGNSCFLYNRVYRK